MNFYFVGTDKSNVETDVIRELQPKRLLVSYHYFKNKKLADYIEKIGYKPEIILDSGAYSAYTSGQPVELDKYISYIQENAEHIDAYISLDILGDSPASLRIWKEMKSRGLDPIPVFHYMNDEAVLVEYLKAGCKRIALGGTVPIKNKAQVAEWVRMLSWMYPANYHLLGSASRKILDHCDIGSADASTWIMAAVMGKPKRIEGKTAEAKKRRAAYNMKKCMDLYE